MYIGSLEYVRENTHAQEVAGEGQIQLEQLNKSSINGTRGGVVIIEHQINVIDVLEYSSKGFITSSLPPLVL